MAKVIPIGADGDLATAIPEFEKKVKTNPLNEYAWNRLMIIYRKLKNYKKELEIVNAAIKTFEDRLNKKAIAPGKKLASLSAAILKATGMADKKGNSIYQPEPLPRWKKRREMVLKRLKK